tara:strand:- start:787 stop:1017 length:231 start_codon:yes stop_codon:yes gene_type:complete
VIYDPVKFEVGDLVIFLNHIDWVEFYVASGELGFIVCLYQRRGFPEDIYDCRVRTLYGGEIDVWFAEIKKLGDYHE